ncbi:MAG: hypothetical protein JRG96_13525 [Deltaproteobacteria bacterium]|nr:hypothetical protein [Deltaproteobacteria bacterium]MBW2418275.1 hypothetical protein [Deltaproteobacteria bacterium]
MLGVAVCLAGCNSTPLQKRAWVEVQTPHYDVVSSLGDARTAALARDLESFRRAAEYVFERQIPPARIRTRVYAMDDRGFDKKFAVRNQSGYLLPRLRGDVIVLRAGGGWAEDASTELKLRYARRLFRSAGALDLPPWYGEGFARLASTLVIAGDRAHVGILDDDHVRRLKRSNWVGVQRVLEASSLAGWSDADREMFDLESWAIAHYIAVGSRGSSGSEDLRGSYLASIGAGAGGIGAGAGGIGVGAGGIGAGDSRVRVTSEVSEVSEVLGGDFGRRVRKYATAGTLDSLTVGLGMEAEETRSRTRALALPEVLAELGRLSLALERAKQAKQFFWDAASRGPQTADLWAGTGSALALMDDWTSAHRHFMKALEIDARDPMIHLDYGNALRARAEGTQDGAERLSLVGQSRDHYRESLELDEVIAESHAMLAASYLIEGPAAAGLTHVDRALALVPASLRARLLRGRLRLREGDRLAARIDTEAILTRARAGKDIRAARALLAEIGSSGS